MKWFSIQGIKKEMERIKWPSKKDMRINSFEVILFTGFFVLFFLIVQFLLSGVLTFGGITG